jgi:SAM-dependent methyltransferase
MMHWHPDLRTDESQWPERIDPDSVPAGILAHHLKKYAFASGVVKGPVLDIACGVGYGSAHLSKQDRSVIGLEVDPAALGVANARYRSRYCHFVRGNAERLPFADESVAAVVCFEGIEHFRDPSSHVREVARVLLLDGVYLVSTPRKGASPDAHENPYHLHEFDLQSFEKALMQQFRDVTMLGQHRLQTASHRLAQRSDVLGIRRIGWVRPIARRLSRAVLRTSPVEESTLSDFVIDENTAIADELIAICRRPLGRPPDR